ncbi:hypothetical protein F5Y18DRAFT_428231 [Xylariaceae sp. FL1019]|nr:hypothetical protein F5Y18DRAFT_428231 [Xylariaceae sp. FL1019]
MRFSTLLGAAALATASPAPQFVDVAAVNDAPTPSLQGPPASAVSQTGVYDKSAVLASIAAEVESFDKRNYPVNHRTSTKKTSTTKSCATSTSKGEHAYQHTSTSTAKGGYPTQQTSVTGQSGSHSTSTSSTSISTSYPVTTSAATSASTGIVPTTCTPVSWTNTNSFTSATACPTPFEVGTYCGFINPEDPCAPQPDGYGPKVVPDTPEAFQESEELKSLALSAKTPKGYTQTFSDLEASVNANTYLGLQTLTSYNVSGCAAACDSTDLCTAFNIYIERDPAWNPDQCSCTSPSSITNFKCSLWGSGVDSAAATNSGQYRDDFEVVITGSNGYSKVNTTEPETPPNWTEPQKCDGVHAHPKTCIGSHAFKGPFDVSVCAALADTYNKVRNNKRECKFFNAFMLKEDGVPVGTYCKLFDRKYEPSEVSYSRGLSSGGKQWDYETSYSYCKK